MRKFQLLLIIAITALSVNGQKKAAFGTQDYIRAMKHATDVMVNDVTSPVAASRYYAYISLAANEAVGLFHNAHPRAVGKNKNYTPPDISQQQLDKANADLAGILAIYEAGVKFLPSGYVLKKNVDSLLVVAAKRDIKKEKIEATSAVVQSIIQTTVSFALTDNFVKLSGLRRFTPANGDEFWQPTAPGFMSAMEPYWFILRPFIIDSASQFEVVPPLNYNTDSTSEFYSQMMEVYRAGTNMTPAERNVANFWDCNPFALQQVGHLEFGIKKISPGGHWMGITGIACKKAKANLKQTAYVHALLAATMADAFIVCWNTKYKYNRVRPETAIKKLVDINWQPFLQTPPFPEYTSGHSVVSSACSKILTNVFGNNFSFVDDTEEEFGLPARKFRSFEAAAEEAAISRLYGGIHFRDAVENGRKEGAQVADFVLRQTGDVALRK